MSRAVLDASAVVALIAREPGAERVRDYLGGALISAVNLAEVYSKAKDKGLTQESLKWITAGLRLEVSAFDEAAAERVGLLREPTRSAGLSLGDRACLALGQSLQVPVITSEKRWSGVAATLGVEVILFR